MSVFGAYACYYNLLYRDKDYAKEAQFIHQLIQCHFPGAQSILDLGCGTGTHGITLVKEGYQVHGVDLSAGMLHQANNQHACLPADLQAQLHFSQGDIRYIRLNQTFDVVLALFHVISYQTTNDDIQAVFETVRHHLKPRGIVIFDVWYGPAVLNNQPSVRVKRLEDENIQVTRIAEPSTYPNENCVDVNYQVFVRNRQDGVVEELHETHRMRYLFKPELEAYLKQNNLRLIQHCEWMTNLELSFNTWGACFIARGID